MLKLLIFALYFSTISSYHVTKMASELIVLDANLAKNANLPVQGVKKINKSIIEHIVLKNCSGTIDQATFKHYPKLSKLTIWWSSIEEITTPLRITRLVVMGSHFPNLKSQLQINLPKLQAAIFLGNKLFEVDASVIKHFKQLKALYISEANFTEDCITKDWFKQMEQLQELGLSDNRISCIAEDAFNHLSSLRKLDLTYNRIAALDKKVFKKLTKLEKLGLYENQLEILDLGVLSSQRNHLDELGLDWNVIKDSNISAEDLLRVLPQVKLVSFGHKDMPNDFKAGTFCEVLRQKGGKCEVDTIFGVSRILGYSMYSSGSSY